MAPAVSLAVFDGECFVQSGSLADATDGQKGWKVGLQKVHVKYILVQYETLEGFFSFRKKNLSVRELESFVWNMV